MTADIIPFSSPRAATPSDAAQPLLKLLNLDESGDVQARYEEVLPIAREFVHAWIEHPEAIADFLAWAHARGALKL